jgi:hypothetical protein
LKPEDSGGRLVYAGRSAELKGKARKKEEDAGGGIRA